MNAPVREPIATWAVTPDGQPATIMAALLRNAEGSRQRDCVPRARKRHLEGDHLERRCCDDVLAFAAALDARGLEAGHALTVIGDNRTRLYIAMMAATSLRAFPSPVFPDVPPDELTYYSRYGEPRIAMAEDQEQVDKLLDLRKRTGRPAVIIYDDPRGMAGYPQDVVVSYEALLAQEQGAFDGRAGARGRYRGTLEVRRHRGAAAFVRHHRRAEGCAAAPSQRVLGCSRMPPRVASLGRARSITPICRRRGSATSCSRSAGALMRFTVNIPERQETVLRDLREVAPTWYSRRRAHGTRC